MNMPIEQIVTIVFLLLWLAFPLGIMLGSIQQDRDAHHEDDELVH